MRPGCPFLGENGPAASALKVAPANLTQLAKNNGGKFPADRVAQVLRAGKSPAHGSSDMPVWGPLFSKISNPQDAIVQNAYHESDQIFGVDSGEVGRRISSSSELASLRFFSALRRSLPSSGGTKSAGDIPNPLSYSPALLFLKAARRFERRFFPQCLRSSRDHQGIHRFIFLICSRIRPKRCRQRCLVAPAAPKCLSRYVYEVLGILRLVARYGIKNELPGP